MSEQLLEEIILNKNIKLEQRFSLLKKILEAICDLHSQGMSHGAITPVNIKVKENGDIRLTEFIIPEGYTPQTNYKLYLAPEKFTREVREENPKASDVYSFGKIMYFVLTGEEPAIITRIRKKQKWLPQEIDDIYKKSIDEIPQQRFQDAREIHERFQKILRTYKREIFFRKSAYFCVLCVIPLLVVTFLLMLLQQPIHQRQPPPPIVERQTPEEETKQPEAPAVENVYNNVVSLLRKKRASDALDMASKYLQENPRDEKMLALRAVANYKLKDIKSAKEDIQKAVEINPHNQRYYLFLVYLNLYETTVSEPLQFVEKAPEDMHDNHILSFLIAEMYFKNREFKKAIEFYEKAITRKDDFFEAHVNKGVAYYMLALTENNKEYLGEALSSFQKAVKLKKDPVALSNYASLCYLTDEETAFKYFQDAIKADQEFADIYFNRAVAYISQKEFRKAQKDIEKAFELNQKLKDAIPFIGEWWAGPRLPVEVNGHAVAIVGDFLYVIGGNINPSGSSDVFFAKISSNGIISKWQRTSPIPGNTSYYSIAIHGDHIYIVGGVHPAEIYVGKPASNGMIPLWRPVGSLPITVYHHDSVIYNDKLFVFGSKYSQTTFNEVCSVKIEPDTGIRHFSVETTLLFEVKQAKALLHNDTIFLFDKDKNLHSFRVDKDANLQSQGVFQIGEIEFSDAIVKGDFVYVIDKDFNIYLYKLLGDKNAGCGISKYYANLGRCAPETERISENDLKKCDIKMASYKNFIYVIAKDRVYYAPVEFFEEISIPKDTLILVFRILPVEFIPPSLEWFSE